MSNEGSLENRCLSYRGPRVRIRLPPARSLQTFGPSHVIGDSTGPLGFRQPRGLGTGLRRRVGGRQDAPRPVVAWKTQAGAGGWPGREWLLYRDTALADRWPLSPPGLKKN